MKNPINNRLSFIDKRIFIKDGINVTFFIVFIISIIFYIILFNIQIDILTFEQSIFIIISAIIFLFNESLISNSTISKISNLLNGLKNQEIKNIIFAKIGKEEKELSANYDEYLNILNERVKEFKENIEIFRKNSYKLYTIFTISGFLSIVFSITTIRIYSNTTFHYIHNILHIIKPYSIELFITLQIFLIPIWILSAHQTEKLKNKTLIFFENPSKIVEDFTKYLQEIEDKKINATIQDNVNH